MLIDKIREKLNQAVRNQDRIETDALRFILSLLHYQKIEKQKDLTDEETVKVLQKEVTKREEAIELFKKGNRPDLIDKENQGIKVIRQFLPQMLSNEEIEQITKEVVQQNPQINQPGPLIGLVLKKTDGKAEGKTVAQVVIKSLSEAKKTANS